jgi:TRAP-type transport system periplasmic protein
MMKRHIPLPVILIAGIFLFSLHSPPAGAAQIKLTYSNFFPPTHIQSILADAWCKEVEARTDNRVRVDYYPGGTLTKAAQIYDGIISGMSDIGMSCLAYTPGRFPVMEVVDLPLGYQSGKAATQVVNRVNNHFRPKELGETEVMYLHAHGPGLLHTKGKAVRKLEDMKGLKMRGTGLSSLVIEALGAVPVPSPMPEAYQNIQKGIVVGSMYPLEANKGWRLGEVTDYVTCAFSAAYTTAFFVVMNKDKWNALPGDIRQIIREINEEWLLKHGNAWDTSDMEGIRYFLNQGNEMIGVDEKESQRWKMAVEPILDEYAAKMDQKGFNGREIVDFTVKALEEVQ